MEFQAMLRLEADGIAILPGFFSGFPLQEAQMKFGWYMRYSPVDEHNQQVFDRKLACQFKTMLFDPRLLRIIEAYWGKPVGLKEFDGKRLLPGDGKNWDAGRWHHDGKHKQVRAMILLTDVSGYDQHMESVATTHKKDRPEGNIYSSRVMSGARVVPCLGNAGTVILFDTNGLHRGKRVPYGRMRDTLMPRYVAKGWASISITGKMPQFIEEM